MSTIRVLVGTRKGAFILRADGGRRQWSVAGPHFAGWEIYHMKGSPADPARRRDCRCRKARATGSSTTPRRNPAGR